MRFGADITDGDVALNFAIAAAGNMVGGATVRHPDVHEPGIGSSARKRHGVARSAQPRRQLFDRIRPDAVVRAQAAALAVDDPGGSQLDEVA